MSRLRVRRVRWARPGLTLIELVVVIGILVALAALLVPQLGRIMTQTGYATSADNTTEVMKNIQQFYTTAGSHYPQNMDSLLNGSGAIDTNVWNGPPGMGTTNNLYTAGALSAMGEYMSFAQVFGTSYTVMDCDDTITDVNLIGHTPRAITSSTGPFAKVLLSSATTALQAAAGFPNGVPNGTELIAMGVGPQCSAVGQTMMSAPLCSGQDPRYYGRCIAIFAVKADTTPATLQCVVDCLGNGTYSSITSFKASTVNTGTVTTTSGTNGL